MIITFEFSEQQQSFHNRFPDEQNFSTDNGWIEIDTTESDFADEFVSIMNNYYRKHRIHMSLEIVKEKWNSYLSKRNSVSSK